MPKNQTVSIDLTAEEKRTFGAARQAGGTLRKSFEEWITNRQGSNDRPRTR